MRSLEITREKRALVVILVALVTVFLFVMKPFLIPMILSGIAVVLFYPLFSRFNDKLKKRRVSALLTTLCILFIVILPTVWIAAILIDQVYSFIGAFDLKEIFSGLFSQDFYISFIEPVLTNIETRLGTKIDLLGLLTNIGKEVARYIYDYSPRVLMGTATFIFDFFIALVGIYFLFLEGPRLIKLFIDVSPLRETHERRLLKRVRDTLEASIFGYLVTGIVQGIIAGIIYAVVGLNAYVVLGVMTFFMSMVPVIGAAGVWIPVCVWLFLQGETWQGVVMLVGGAGVISSIDNFLKPVIIQGRTNIHPLLIFFSLFGGIKVFGPLGILFGPVITALLIATINIYREEVV